MGILTSLFSPSAISESELRGLVAWLADVGKTGRMTSAGVRVDESSALTLSAVFASARAVAEDVSVLPLKVYRRLDGGGKEPATSEPKYLAHEGRRINLYSLVHDIPNHEQTTMAFRSLLIWWSMLWGNGYAEIERDGAGNPVALWPIHPLRVEPKRDARGRMYYEVRPKEMGGKPDQVAARNMIHVSGMSDDGAVGLMIAELAKESFGIYMAAERFTGTYFGNGATLAGVIQFDHKFKDQQSLEDYRRRFNEKYQGAGKANQWMVADSGAKVTTIANDPEKSLLVDTIRFRIEDVARWFRVPPVVIGHNTNTPYTNVESLGMMYVKQGLVPWAMRVQQEFTRKLVPYDRDDLFIEHVIDALMWADSKTRAEFHNLSIRGGWGSPNEARSIENMNPYPGGDAFRVEQNLAVLDENGHPIQANKPDPSRSAPSDDDPGDGDGSRAEAAKLAMMPVFVDAAERVLSRETLALAKKKSPTREWLVEFYERHHEHVAAAMSAPIASLSKMAGTNNEGLAERYADAHVGESMRRLKAGEDPQQWLVSRPAWIAEHLTNEVCYE